MKKSDFLLLGALLLTAAVLYLFLRPGGAGTWAVVTADGQEQGRYPLSRDVTVAIGGESYNVLQIANGKAAVIEANCGDQTCVRMGTIFREGETIVCLPHRVTVRIEGDGAASFDAVAG